MKNHTSNWHAIYADRSSTPWTPEAWKAYCEDGEDLDAQRRYRLSREPYLALKHLQLSPRDRMLEAGCGYGRITAHLIESGATVTGCDISPKMVEFCDQRFKNAASFSIGQFDIARLPFPDQSFDKVLCTGVLMCVDDYREVVSELSRVLRVGGTLVISLNSGLCPLYQLWKLQGSLLRLLKKLTHKPTNRSVINCKPQSPLSVLNFVKKQKLRIVGIEADTLFCGDYRIAKIAVPIFPTFGFSLYKLLDRFLCDKVPFSFFGWEVWYVAKKNT